MSARTPLLVGLLLVAATASLTWFVMLSSKDKYGTDSTYPVFADFVDASGIRWKTRVQINGLDVGKIANITHVPAPDGRLTARVEIRLLNEYVLYDNASLRKAAESLLGDFRLDLDPGTPDRPRLAPGEVIRDVQSVSDIEEIQLQLKQVAGNVNEVTDSFKKVLAGPEGEGSLKAILERVERSMAAIEQVTTSLGDIVGKNDAVLSDTIQDLGVFAHRLAAVSAPDGELTQLSGNLNQLSGRLNQIAGSLNDLVASEGEGWESGQPGSVRHTLRNVNQSLERLNAIARKIDEGQGTAGRLVNDPAIADKVEQALDDTSEIIGGLSRLETQIELRSEYAVPFGRDNQLVQAAIKNTLGLRLQPKPDKYYLLEAVADPRGKQTRTVTSTTAGGTTTSVEQTVIAFDELKFSAQFAKRYHMVTLRFGLIENTGGLGANLHLLDDLLEVRLDLYDFTRRDPTRNEDIFPRLRTLAMVEFIDHLHLQAGLDDPLNPRLRTWFVGGALRFADDDLKALLTVAPTP